MGLHDKLEGVACGAAFSEADAGVDAPYETPIGLAFPLAVEAGSPSRHSWWTPPVFKALPRKVLRLVFYYGDLTFGTATFNLDVGTYLGGAYDATRNHDNMDVDVAFPDQFHRVTTVDVDITGLLDFDASHDYAEVALLRLPNREGLIDADIVELLSVRTLNDDEIAAAQAAGSILPWI